MAALLCGSPASDQADAVLHSAFITRGKACNPFALIVLQLCPFPVVPSFRALVEGEATYLVSLRSKPRE